jgi:hypothetical protein
VEISHNGRFLFTVNTGSGSISNSPTSLPPGATPAGIVVT